MTDTAAIVFYKLILTGRRWEQFQTACERQEKSAQRVLEEFVIEYAETHNPQDES